MNVDLERDELLFFIKAGQEFYHRKLNNFQSSIDDKQKYFDMIQKLERVFISNNEISIKPIECIE